jgi:hypothetical protein
MTNNEKIKAIHKEILEGKTVSKACKEIGISPAYYYQKLKEIGLNTKKKEQEKQRTKPIKSINDMHDLAQILNTDFNTIHKHVNTKNSIEKNIKRMNYLKLHSPIKFQEAVKITILNFYKMDALKLIKTLNNM